MNKKVPCFDGAGAAGRRVGAWRTACLLPGLVLMGLHNAAAAEGPACLLERKAVTQKLGAGLPADPATARAALELRRDGEVLCHNGAEADGRAKLEAAAAKLDPVSGATARPPR